MLGASDMNVDRFYRMALNMFAGKPGIRECEDWSILRCVMNAAELGLEIGGAYKPHCYVVPHRIRKDGGRDKVTAQLYISYYGVMELARRAGITGFHADIWQEKDNFKCRKGTHPVLIHERSLPEADAGDWMGAYCVWTTVRGDKQFVQLFHDEILKRREKSASFKGRNNNDSPWIKHPRSMWKKSAVHEGGKFMEMDRRLQRALELESLAEGGEAQTPSREEFLEVFPSEEEQEQTRTEEVKDAIENTNENRDKYLNRFRSMVREQDEHGDKKLVSDFFENNKLDKKLDKMNAEQLSALCDDFDFQVVMGGAGPEE